MYLATKSGKHACKSADGTKRQSSPIVAQMANGERSKTFLEQCLPWETQNYLHSQTQLTNGLVPSIDVVRLRLDLSRSLHTISSLMKRMNNGLESKNGLIAVEMH